MKTIIKRNKIIIALDCQFVTGVISLLREPSVCYGSHQFVTEVISLLRESSICNGFVSFVEEVYFLVLGGDTC